MIRLLILHGATVMPDALFSAIDIRLVDVLEAFLVDGVDPNSRREKLTPTPKIPENYARMGWGFLHEHEYYPVHYAAMSYKTSTGSTPDEERQEAETVVKLIEVLLAHGADPFARFTLQKQVDDEGTTSDEDGTVLHDILLDGHMV